MPEEALIAKITARFGDTPPFELEMGGTHTFIGLGHSDAGVLARWFEQEAAALSLEVYDPQREKPSAEDDQAFEALEARAAAEPDDGVFRWRKEARHGDVVAMNELGNCFAAGEGVNANQSEAIRWYEKAAAKDFVPALINLAECYRSGDGVAQDASVAVSLYERAYAKDKCVPAFALGEMHRDGEGVAKSVDRAEEFFTMARANRHPEAYLALKAIGRAPID
jgi:TPR repeat protein